MFGWNPKQLWGPSDKRNVVDATMNVSPREVLQNLGDWARGYKKDAYVDFALFRVKIVQEYAVQSDPILFTIYHTVRKKRWTQALHKPAKHVVISDVRFKNEVEKIKKAGGKIIRLDRFDNSMKTTATKDDIFKHISESEQANIDPQKIDYVIINNGSKEDLYDALSTFVRGRYRNNNNE
jgi:hypothetical protein